MSRPLRFLHLTTFYPPYSFGGDAMYIYRLCHALGDEGHHVDVVHCRDSYHMQHPAEPEIHFDDHPRVRTFPLRSRFGRLSPLATQQTGRPWFKGRAIRQLLAENDYDVIEFHNTSLIGPTAFAWEPRHRRAVKLYFTHEHWLICPTHVLYKFNERPCEKPECLKCTLLARRPPQLWRYTGLLRRMSRHIDRFVSPSRFTARMHAERGFSQPVGHLPYFIDLTDSDWRSPAPRPHPRPYFLFVGRLEQIKGLQTLLTLWDRVPEADLLVAGAGNHEAELKKLAGDNPRIKFLGPRPQSELGALYYHSLACLVPSITYETFGIIAIEAFARKTPVISRDLGALPEVIDDSGGGFKYRSDEELLSAMKQIATQPELRSRLGQQGYGALVRNWCRDAHLKMYHELIDELAERKFGDVPWRGLESTHPVPLAARQPVRPCD